MPFLEKAKEKLKQIKQSLSFEKTKDKKGLYGIVASFDELIKQRRPNFNILTPPSFKVSSVGSGAFRSPFRGRGMEFDEVRLYQPTDDVRTIDWRVTAKTGKTHTKLFHEEKERPVYLLVDLRPQMRFGTKNAFKSVVGARIASIIGWSAIENNDKIGAFVISSRKNVQIKAQRSTKNLMTIVKSLSEGTKDNGKKQGTSLSKAVLDLKNAVLTGACVFVISDFYDYDEDLFKHLGQLATKADVACIHVYDVLEEKAPPAGMYRISDGKEVSTINSSDEKWCEAFEDYFKKQKEEIEKFCHQRRISYLNIRTDEKDLPKALRYKLHTQKRRSIGVSSMRKEA